MSGAGRSHDKIGGHKHMDDQARKRIGAQIKTARGTKAWTQEQLATEAGVTANTVRAMERGENVQAGKLAAVYEALGMEPLSTTMARQGYSPDVVIVRDVIGMWLEDLPEGERAARVTSIIRHILNGNHDGGTGE